MLLWREEVESEFKFNLFVSSFENILLNSFPLFSHFPSAVEQRVGWEELEREFYGEF